MYILAHVAGSLLTLDGVSDNLVDPSKEIVEIVPLNIKNILQWFT